MEEFANTFNQFKNIEKLELNLINNQLNRIPEFNENK